MGPCKLRKDFLKNQTIFLKTKKILAIRNKKRQKKREREKPKILVEDDINLNKMNW